MLVMYNSYKYLYMFSGWFSLINDKGERCALMHSTLLHLVREQVCSFLSLVSFTAYTAHPPDPTGKTSRHLHYNIVVQYYSFILSQSSKYYTFWIDIEQICKYWIIFYFWSLDALPRIQYLKTVVRAGQVFRLRAVFQHRDKPEAGRHSTRSDRMSSRSARDRDLANRYAQLIDINNQVSFIFTSLKINNE